MKFWSGYKYKNLTFLFISLLLAIALFRNESFHTSLLGLGSLSYFGAFIAGALFVSTFTVATGAVVLLVLAESFPPVNLGLIAAIGAMFGDFIIFHSLRNKGFIDELKLVFESLGGNRIFQILHTKYFSWTLPVIGAIIIASPLPDEMGVSLMGISKMKTYQFLLLSFVLNFIGIFLVISASTVIKP